MVISYVWCGFVLISAIFILLTGNGSAATKALLEGAGDALQISLTIAGPICLWAGIGQLMQAVGAAHQLSRLFLPLLKFLYPTVKKDPILAEHLSGNFCANLLGLGNAATPMGICAVKRLQNPHAPSEATDEMCRLVVMNTASIQLLPTTVAALRHGAGSATPFDIIPCVWVTSVLSVSAGLGAAYLMKRWWRNV